MAEKGMKPYVKLASTLVLFGSAMFTLERYGLSKVEDGHSMHIDGTILSILVILPVVLVLVGAVIFMVGRMRRL